MSISAGSQTQLASAQTGQPAQAGQPFPWNRVAVLLGPVVAAVSGAAAAWLLKHFPGLHLSKTTLASTISEAVVFAVAAAGTYALHHKWLGGWQQYEQSLTEVKQTAQELTPGTNGVALQHALGAFLPPTTNGSGVVNGQPPAAVYPDLPPGAILVDAVLPLQQEELSSVPGGPGDDSEQRLETAVRPDEPINELQHIGA